MASQKIPSVFSQWILNQLPERSKTKDDINLEYNGLRVLNVKELKIIERLLYNIRAVREESSIKVRTLSSLAKKQQRIDFIRRALYRDDECTVINQDLIKELQLDVAQFSSADGTSTSKLSPVKSVSATKLPSNPPSSGKKRNREPTHRNRNTGRASPKIDGSNMAAITQQTNDGMDHGRQGNNSQPHAAAAAAASHLQPIGNAWSHLNIFGPLGQLGAANNVTWPHGNGTCTTPNFPTAMMSNQQNADLLRQAAISASVCSSQFFPHYGSASWGGPAGTMFPYPPQLQIANGHPYQFQSLASMATTNSNSATSNGNNNNNGESNNADHNNSSTSPSDQNMPPNTTESQIMSQLSQMGFTDREEMINGIRNSGKTTADEVMLFIVTQREEAEEARKIDQARLMSEEQKQEEEDRKMTRRLETLAAAKTARDLREIFKRSWILDSLIAENGRASTRVAPELLKKRRCEFLQLLDLEDKAAKWYNTVPSHYFRNVCERLKNDYDGTLDWLPIECEKLQRGLTMLEEQTRGRPRLFVEACENATGTNDSEVIVID